MQNLKAKKNLIISIMLVVSALLMVSCDLRYGIIESELELAPESRLPKWFSLPTNYSRKDVTLTLTFYTHPFLKKVKMVLSGPAPESKILKKQIGSYRWHPTTELRGYDKHPTYIIITVDKYGEVFEQRRLEPFLYVTDDPNITSVLKQH